MHGQRQRLDVVQDAVDPEPDHRVLRARLEVDVRSTLLERVVEQVVDRRDDVLVVRRGGELGVAAQLHELHERAAGGAAPELCLRLGDLRPEAVDAVDDRDDVALRGDDIAQRRLDQLLELIAERGVERVGDRDRDRVALARDRDHHVAVRERARERLRDEVVVDRERVDLQVGSARRLREHLRYRVFVDLALLRIGIGEVRRRDQLGRRHVVARGGLRAHRADALFEHAALQRGGSRRHLAQLALGEQLVQDQQIEQLFEAERGAHRGAHHGTSPGPRRGGPLRTVLLHRPDLSARSGGGRRRPGAFR